MDLNLSGPAPCRVHGMQSLSNADNRTDEEIAALLCQPKPVTSEKNVWAFWDKGFASLRPWAKRNTIGWVRILGPRWTVRVLDIVEGSALTVQNYVEEEYLPECFNSRTMSGPYSGQHSSDMVRLACLYKYGGVYMDVGVLLIRHLDDICWKSLTDASSSIRLVFPSLDFKLASAAIGNFFIATKKGNEFIYRWMKVFLEVWKARSHCQGIHLHPLFDHLLKDGSEASNLASHQHDYFAQSLAMERVRLLRDSGDGFDGHKYFEDHVALLEYLESDAATVLSNRDGNKALKFLSMQREPLSNNPDYNKAKRFSERLLTNTAMIKMYHWSKLESPTLAQLWDLPENENADNEPGSFGEWLRFASWNYTQQRTFSLVKFPKLQERLFIAGLLQTRT